MRIIFLVISIVIFFTSCLNEQEVKDHHLLISSTSKYIMEDGEDADGYYGDRLNFIKPYTSLTYKEDTIFASTLHEINACGNSKGAIHISNDTLYLLTRKTSNEACASITFTKFDYVIYNPEGKKYVVEY